MKINNLLNLSLAFLLSLSCFATQSMDSSLKLTIKELTEKMQQCSLLASDGSSVARLVITNGDNLAIFGSSLFDTIDISTMPPEVAPLIPIVKSIKTKHDLKKVTMICDLYVPLAYRGNGYAHQLLKETCTHIFNQGVKTVVLAPGPFEYQKDGQTIVLNDENKKQRLIKLYQSCGFTTEGENAALYMYRHAENS